MAFGFCDLYSGFLLSSFAPTTAICVSASTDESNCCREVYRNDGLPLETRLHGLHLRALDFSLPEGTETRTFLEWVPLPLCPLHQSYTYASDLAAARYPAPRDTSQSTEQAPPQRAIASCDRWWGAEAHFLSPRQNAPLATSFAHRPTACCPPSGPLPGWSC